MTGQERAILPAALLVILFVVFYPALFLDRVLAPQAALWSEPPWSHLGGPNPAAMDHTRHWAVSVAPRLALLARWGTETMLWNPFMGGGRVGWLALGADGYTPFTVLAVVLAPPTHHWLALACLTLGVAFAGCFFLARSAVGPAAAVIAATVYALSGPVISQWPAVPGTVAALAPWLLLVALRAPQWHALGPAAALVAAMVVGGGFGLSWVAVLPALVVIREKGRWRAFAWVLAALAAGLALALPSLFLAFFAGEAPGFWWFSGRSAPSFSWWDLVRLPDPGSPGAGATLFTGWPAVILAGLGLAAPFALRTLAGLLAAAGAFATFALGAWVPFLAAFPPTSFLSLGLALLAGGGVQWLLAPVQPRLHWPLTSALAYLILWRLLPAASLWLPWESRERITLSWDPPAPLARGFDWSLPLVTLLPPDSAALVGLGDIRARSFAGEPVFRRLLSPGMDGSVHFSRITDPVLPQLGVRWAVEPKQLWLVSGELFARLVLREAEAAAGTYAVLVPPQATRLGIKMPTAPVLVRLLQGQQSWVLTRDQALAGEADGWWWWKVPKEVQGGPAGLVTDPQTLRQHPRLSLAWDCSGWDLVEESQDVRLWEQRWVRPLAAWAEPTAEAKPPQVLRQQPQRLEVSVETAQPRQLVLRVKFRPQILQATVDGAAVPLQAHHFPWSTLTVPPGVHRVCLRFALPLWVWAAPFLGLGALAGLQRLGL
ncbi:MAG: hypothetical protein N2447_01990 [Thermoanaerobaculum sp.]|nr:hypothetical protein [Thermoanaerobaculum sp.]